jgi:hypothetical protein
MQIGSLSGILARRIGPSTDSDRWKGFCAVFKALPASQRVPRTRGAVNGPIISAVPLESRW